MNRNKYADLLNGAHWALFSPLFLISTTYLSLYQYQFCSQNIYWNKMVKCVRHFYECLNLHILSMHSVT